MNNIKSQTIALAITGASGIIYAQRLLECLLQDGHKVWLMYSKAAQTVACQEMDWILASKASDAQLALQQQFKADNDQLSVFAKEDWFAPLASGSNTADAMVICPASMGSVAAIAQGLADNLIERAADVCIKENTPLIIVPRESPFSAIHLENMLKLARLGVTIIPPNPAFYHRPQQIIELVDFVVARILDHLKIEHQLVKRWSD